MKSFENDIIPLIERIKSKQKEWEESKQKEWEERRKEQEALQHTETALCPIKVVETKPIKNLFVSGVRKKYEDCSFENFQGNEKLIARLKSLISLDSEGFLLRGPSGCGKTHLAVAIAREYAARFRIETFFVNVSELLLHIRGSFRENSLVTEEELVDRYMNYDFLVLDDLGSEKVSDFSISTLYLILDGRINDLKPTVVTTNLSQEEIETTLGGRIASRLSLFHSIKINMPDYRKKKRTLEDIKQ